MANKTEVIISAKDETQQAINSAVGGINRLKGAGDLLQSGLAGLGGGLAAGLLGAGFTSTIKEAIDSLDKMDEAAERIGMTTEALSGLAYAGRLNGLEFDDMTTAITKLSVKMQEAAAGGKEAAALFKDVGVSVTDANGALKPADQLLSEVADRFSQFKDGAEKTALAVDLFGKSGAKLVPLLNGGADGLEKMRKEAEALGGVFDGKLAKQAAEFNDNLDRLSVLSASAGKAIAAQLLPSLNDTAQAFLDAAKEGKTFDAIVRGIAGIGKLPFDLFIKGPDLSVVGQIKDLKTELATLENKKKDGQNGGLLGRLVFGDQKDLDQRIAVLKNQIEALEKYGQRPAAATDQPAASDGKSSIARTPSDGGKKAKETAEATDAAKAYAKAMEDLAKVTTDADAAQLGLSKSQRALYDLMTSAEWGRMPDEWKQAAVEQFEFAYATEQASEELARLNKLLGETQSSKINETQKDMLLLAKTLENGRISEEQYLEAVNARLNEGAEKLEKNRSLAEEFGLTFTSALEDAVATGKGVSGVLKGIEQDILRIIARLAITEPLMKAASGINWGGLIGNFVTAWLGGSSSSSSWSSSTPGYSSGDLGSGIRLNALGNIYNSPALSAYAGSVVSSPTLFPFAKGIGLMGEAGAEGIFPLKRGKDGKLGVSAEGVGGVTINVINNTDATARTERRSDGKGGSIIDIFIERARGAITSDIMLGNGSVPAAMESVYNLSRAAGAY